MIIICNVWFIIHEDATQNKGYNVDEDHSEEPDDQQMGRHWNANDNSDDKPVYQIKGYGIKHKLYENPLVVAVH